jgi:hypothetical protein
MLSQYLDFQIFSYVADEYGVIVSTNASVQTATTRSITKINFILKVHAES